MHLDMYLGGYLGDGRTNFYFRKKGGGMTYNNKSIQRGLKKVTLAAVIELSPSFMMP
jgi:hypothetical protein